MVVSGLPSRNGDHAYQIASMSLSILKSVRNFKLQHMPDKEIQARIGIHSGIWLLIDCFQEKQE